MITAYRILIADLAYSSWTWRDLDTDAPVIEGGVGNDFHPASRKVFSGDVVGKCGQVLHSPTREFAAHAGVLQIADNRTFGRKGKRMLYKCLPDDPFLPVFLVPFDIDVGFEKQRCNKYVVFRFDSWDEKHPHGKLVETLGDVSSLAAFYEYQLYCKRLHDSVKRLTEDARKQVQRFPLDTYVCEICARFHCPTSTEVIFSIDPPQSLDFDDAVSIQEDANVWRVSIYIANVVFWLEALDLWNSLTNRVATIYLPDRRRPMLPSVLSDSLCSLQENEDRFAFVCDFVVDKATATLQQPPGFRHAHVRVAKNYRYEEASLCANADYQCLLALTQRLDPSCKDSHDVVAYWMVETNAHCARHFASQGVGIFRSVRVKEEEGPPAVPVLSESCRRVIHLWNNNASGQYQLYDKDETKLQHDVLKRPLYVHMTSPIRRLVDLLNQLVFFGRCVSLSPAAEQFRETWIKKMDFINCAMRSIRKVQNECQLIYQCTQDPAILLATHRGVVFDKMERGDNVYTYMVYVEALDMMSRVRTTENVGNFAQVECKLLLFENEEKTKRKVRVSILKTGLA
jgi:exoribonuclease R